MSGIIHFVSGKTLDISEAEFAALSPKLGMKGVKCHKSAAGHLIPMNSTTMEFIEHIEEEEKVVPEQPVAKAEKVVKEEPKTNDEIMAAMVAKSNCTHENQSLFVQHTAKGIRYFPICDFCGKRDRYVSEKKIVDGEYEKWSTEDVENAKPWEEE